MLPPSTASLDERQSYWDDCAPIDLAEIITYRTRRVFDTSFWPKVHLHATPVDSGVAAELWCGWVEDSLGPGQQPHDLPESVLQKFITLRNRSAFAPQIRWLGYNLLLGESERDETRVKLEAREWNGRVLGMFYFRAKKDAALFKTMFADQLWEWR
jgi:hypothetical protein